MFPGPYPRYPRYPRYRVDIEPADGEMEVEGDQHSTRVYFKVVECSGSALSSLQPYSGQQGVATKGERTLSCHSSAFAWTGVGRIAG